VKEKKPPTIVLVKQTPMKCRFFEKNYTFLLIYP
jgi:hypothetical protein